MTAALQIAASSLARSIRDRSFVVLGIVAPLLLIAALSFTIGAAFSGEYRPSLVLADETGTSTAIDLAATLETRGFEDVEVVDDASLARAAIDDGTADAAIVFTTGAVQSGEPVEVVVDNSREIGAEIAGNIATEAARNFETVRTVLGLGAPVGDLVGPIAVTSTATVGSSVLTDATYFAVGMSSYFTFIAAASLLAAHHRERRQSTLARMLTAPIGRFAPITGRALGVAVLTACALSVLVVTSTIGLDADWGPVFGTLIVGGAITFCAVGVSSAVVALTDSETAASQVAMVLGTAWAILGGVFVPTPATGPLAVAANFSPFTWTLEAIGLNAGVGTMAEVATSAAAVAAFGIAGIALGAARRQRLVMP